MYGMQPKPADAVGTRQRQCTTGTPNLVCELSNKANNSYHSYDDQYDINVSATFFHALSIISFSNLTISRLICSTHTRARAHSRRAHPRAVGGARSRGQETRPRADSRQAPLHRNHRAADQAVHDRGADWGSGTGWGLSC
jgi:hypothetical protein